MKLTSDVRMVLMQFSFSNPNAVPDVIRRVEPENWTGGVQRRMRSTGVMVMEPTPSCSMLEFPAELEDQGYELVDALVQKRPDQKDRTGKAVYHAVRFTFVRREFASELSEAFQNVRGIIREELLEMCCDALWRVRAFDNPFFRDDEEVPGQRVLVVNLEARTPLFRANGEFVTVWQKDAAGNRVGDEPLPLEPTHHLRIVDGTVSLVPVC